MVYVNLVTSIQEFIILYFFFVVNSFLIMCARKQTFPDLGLLVMRKFLFVGIVFAAVLHFMLHIFVQKRAISTLPTDSVKDIQSCYNAKFHLILNVSDIEPFMCEDYKKQSAFLGSNRIDLPYGTRRGDRYFDMALKKLPKCDLPDEIRNISCKKCVVVGNGGVLRNSTLGKKIDSYDVIIRMNDGPVLGYEDDVGQRTTFRLCYPESIFANSLHYDPNSTIVLMMFKPHDVKWLSELLFHRRVSTYGFWRKPAMNLIYKPHQLRVLNPFILRQVSQNLLNFPSNFPKTEKPKHPTTGIIAITLAFHICNEVHIAGFKYNLTSLNSSLHYYGNETMSVMAQNEYHNISAEQMFLRDLIEQKTVTNLT
ncbi:type 2 lactosamine alpha-2,3-sialyltransferase isoform X2 [Rana temporaria]|uniref:type 2 lactosamine alpha-2,3-sialyltransferase isoform X2 n=1 Tax=Rana temporaria TaxID=8407 RepID=UPI001AAC89E2|nr:type 2 lactosamine alpha-2,3-sialyltransferase isoform X2 [Rana temporaria]